MRGRWFKLMGRAGAKNDQKEAVGSALREAYKINDDGDAAMKRLIEQMRDIEGTKKGETK